MRNLATIGQIAAKEVRRNPIHSFGTEREPKSANKKKQLIHAIIDAGGLGSCS